MSSKWLPQTALKLPNQKPVEPPLLPEAAQEGASTPPAVKSA